MTKENLKNILTAVRDMIRRNRVAYKDYLGEVTETKTMKILEDVVLSEDQWMLPVADAAFSGFVVGKAYRVVLNGEEKSIVAKDSNGAGVLSNAEDFLNPPDDYWALQYDSEAGKMIAKSSGAFLGATISVYYDETVTTQKWSVKKLAYELLPDRLLSDLEETMEKLSSQIKSLQVDPVFTGSFSQNRMPDTDIGAASHAEGNNTTASGIYSHAEGRETTASQNASHAEGRETTASGIYSHAEGRETTASGAYSHAEGFFTEASQNASHAEGHNTTASGIYSHAEGFSTEASQNASHAEGNNTTASGAYSHAEGFSTTASANYQHVEGIYNIDDGANGDKLHIVGNGTSLKRSNAHTLDKSGNAWYAGDVYVGSTSGTNRDAGSKKLATEAYVDNTKLVITSPGGKKFKVTVDDAGTLSATEVTNTTT